jgi:GxxExxY protein
VTEWPARWGDVPDVVNGLAGDVIAQAMPVHDDLGPGLLEKPYQLVLARRLADQGHTVRVEHPLALVVDGLVLDKAYFADLVVDDLLLLEIKSVEDITLGMIKQTKTYLRLGGYPLGLILNFRKPRLYTGIKRIVP